MPIRVEMILNTGFITDKGEEFEGEEVKNEFGITDDMSDEEIIQILDDYAKEEMNDVSIGYSFERI